MNKKEIIELKNRINDARSKVSALEKLLEENADQEIEFIAPALIAQKNNLLIESKLGADNGAELTQIERRIIEATKSDNKLKESQSQKREFVKTIQLRLDLEKESMNCFIDEYNAAASRFLSDKLAEKERSIQESEEIRLNLIIEMDALESIAIKFDKQFDSYTTNKQRVFELWGSSGIELSYDPFETKTQKEISSITDYLKKQGIEEINFQ